jgi:hypothetical protein
MIKEVRPSMGYAKKRTGKDGRPRYTAVYVDLCGHASIMTTQRYLHTLPDADETAVEAFSRIRNRGTETSSHASRRSA